MIQESIGVVLAGGNSSRFGSNKAMAPWGEGKLIEAAVKVLSSLFPLSLVFIKNAGDFSFLNNKNVQVVEDLIPAVHSLGGIYSALHYSKKERIFICGCDMPFIEAKLVESLWAASLGYDIAVPVWQGKSQPLCGFYSRRCIHPIEEMIQKNHLSVQELFNAVKTRFFLEEEIKTVDPQGLSFWDLDTFKDYERAKEYACRLL